MRGKTHKGTFVDFLNSLRAFESGLDPEKFDWYVKNYNQKVIEFPAVKEPGRILRNWETGEHTLKLMTVKEFFKSTGVDLLFDLNNRESIQEMQYKTINPWGFVGYQIGEAILITTGYYLPEINKSNIDHTGTVNDKYYVHITDPSSWKHDNTEISYTQPGIGKKIIATDVNYWNGTFTGKNNIHSLEDLMKSESQELIIRDIMRHNLESIISSLLIHKISRKSILEKKWKCENNKEIHCSISGILASCHLCGAQGTFNFLESSTEAYDELGTPILSYMDMFSNYETIFDF